YHVLWYASQTGVSVIGPQRGKEQTFALAADWLPPQVVLDRDEALRTLAQRFFRSHGPAAKTDFTGWTGLTATDTKAAIAMLGDELAEVSVAGRELLCTAAALDSDGWRDGSAAGDGAASRRASGAGAAAEPLVLPGFDEFLLGYKDRSLAADPDAMAAVIPGGNGVFRNTVTIGGQVQATWKRTARAKRIDITVLPLPGWRPTKAVRASVERAFVPYGEFLGSPTAVAFA
ncbi:MAG: DNA glycosylase AlkZ-like family protein, partial [Candidatus Nanopelagicales bacterium]